MNIKIPRYDINREPFMTRAPDFNGLSIVLQTERAHKTRIIAVIPLSPEEKLFQIQILDLQARAKFSFLPGQFVMLELPGYGEVAISISGSSSHSEFIELCIRKVGKVTGMIHRLTPGSIVGIRGPFGTYFPMQKTSGSNVLLIAGGLGHGQAASYRVCFSHYCPAHRGKGTTSRPIGAPLCNIRDLLQPVDLEVNLCQAAMAPVRVYGEHDFAAPGEPGAQARGGCSYTRTLCAPTRSPMIFCENWRRLGRAPYPGRSNKRMTYLKPWPRMTNFKIQVRRFECATGVVLSDSCDACGSSLAIENFVRRRIPSAWT
ncbi:MAG: hypothetical protein E4G99_05950 [Anaerolineales bacterium]|nr:MAG: hypothetical protein E4G99_05950 [Anaerolineales bacterium]